jgi:ribosomal protein S12 methylthiotransferase accessory factor
MDMHIRFPGGKRVYADYKGFTIETDQPRKEGGDDSAPEPFSLFLASLGTCAGVYVLYFCEERQIDTAGLQMMLSFEKDAQTHLVSRVGMQIQLPPGFPPKYKKAVIKAAQLCTVKRNIANPPEFTITAEIQG